MIRRSFFSALKVSKYKPPSRPSYINHHAFLANQPLLRRNLVSATSDIPSSNDKNSEDLMQDGDVEQTTGAIEQESPRQGLIYYDRVFIVVRMRWLRKLTNLILGRTPETITQDIQKYTIPEGLPIEMDRVIPRDKDGGAFVKFTVKDPSVSVKDVEIAIANKLKNDSHRSWINLFQKIRMFPVKGTPWIEDLRRINTSKLLVEFEGPDLSQEDIYLLFRRYGPIKDIIPPSPGSKDLPRCASVAFTRMGDAATAKNCLNAMKYRDTELHILFQKLQQESVFRVYVLNHPRIFIPIFVALIAGLTVLIFEPIRVWFIRKKICGEVFLKGVKLIDFARESYSKIWDVSSDISDMFFGSQRQKSTPGQSLWDDRIETAGAIKQCIDDGLNTFIVVSGPRGSGKHQLVTNHAMKDRKNVYKINCDVLVKAKTDSAFTSAAAGELGYYPVFPWMSSVSLFMDTIAQGLTGQKTGFAENSETQFKNMLATALSAITKTALENKKKVMANTKKDEKGSDSSTTETTDFSDTNYLQTHPEEKPVVIIEHFLSRTDDKTWLFKQIADWCASLIEYNVAHVIFITSEVDSDRILSEALPNRVVKEVYVGDASRESAKGYIEKQLEGQRASDDEKDTSQHSFSEGDMDKALRPLGGRMTDLQAFARRLKSGEKPISAASAMIDQSCTEVAQMYLFRQSSEWTREQVWALIKLLAKANEEFSENKKRTAQSPFNLPEDASVSMGSLVQDSNFKTIDQQKSLRALEKAEMISMQLENGRMASVKAGKPLYQAAFNALAADKALRAYIESSVLENAIAKEENNIAKYEDELDRISRLQRGWRTAERETYVGDKLYASQKKIMELEKMMAEQVKVMKNGK